VWNVCEVEVWQIIPSHPDYEASTLGRIKRRTSRTSGKAGHVLSAVQREKGRGYTCVTLKVNGKWRNVSVHRLVAETFLRLTADQVVNHKNAISSDNRVENLECVDQQENVRHSYQTGRQSRQQNRGERNGQAKITEATVRAIRATTDRAYGCYARIGRIFSLSSRQVADIINNRAWKDVA
jgi:hypothetical protein